MSLDSRQRTALAFVMAMVVIMPSSPRALVRAQAAPAIGTQVVIKAGAGLKVGDNVVDTGKSHRIYKVEQSKDGWLWIAAGKIAGWARAADVIPLSNAIDFYTAEIAREPHSAWPYYNRGLIYQDHGNVDKAFADYSSALRQDSKYVNALINRGNIWLSKKTPDRAITDYSDAIEADPTAILPHVNRGIAWQIKNDYDKALADYNEAIRLGLKTAPAFNNRGHARKMKRDYDGAIVDYNEAIELDPGYALAWMNRGIAREAKGEFDLALADLAEATRLNPKSPWGYSHRAWILATCPEERYRNGKEAVALATEASELEGARDASLIDIRATAHAEDGDFAKAIFWETNAIDLAAKKAGGEADVYRSRLKLFKENKPYRDGTPTPHGRD